MRIQSYFFAAALWMEGDGGSSVVVWLSCSSAALSCIINVERAEPKAGISCHEERAEAVLMALDYRAV